MLTCFKPVLENALLSYRLYVNCRTVNGERWAKCCTFATTVETTRVPCRRHINSLRKSGRARAMHPCRGRQAAKRPNAAKTLWSRSGIARQLPKRDASLGGEHGHSFEKYNCYNKHLERRNRIWTFAWEPTSFGVGTWKELKLGMRTWNKMMH